MITVRRYKSHRNSIELKEKEQRLISTEMLDYRAAQQICANRRSICLLLLCLRLRRKWYYYMKIMQLIGTKNCKVFVNHVELIANSTEYTSSSHTEKERERVRALTFRIEICPVQNRKPRQVHENPTTNKFNQNACKKPMN